MEHLERLQQTLDHIEAHLRAERPLLIAAATNDALSANLSRGYR